jgi:uncharacterized membrane protein
MAQPATSTAAHEHLIEIGHVGGVVMRALLMLAESVLVPTAILYGCMRTVGTVPGLAGVLCWCGATMGLRFILGRRVPSTLLLVVGILVARTAIALAASSVWLYLLQPVAASILMSVVFVGSALIGRPVTQRLAEDFVRLPERLLADRRMRRVFIEVALIWGVSRAIDAGIGLDSLHWGAGVGVLARGVLSTGLTALSIGACVYWGWRRVQAIPGVRFSIGTPLAP